MRKFWTKFINETEGQDLIEYALLAATIALGVIAGMNAVKGGINNEFTAISSKLSS